MHTFIQIYWCIIGVNVATVYQCHHLPSSASLIMHDGFDPICLTYGFCRRLILTTDITMVPVILEITPHMSQFLRGIYGQDI